MHTTTNINFNDILPLLQWSGDGSFPSRNAPALVMINRLVSNPSCIHVSSLSWLGIGMYIYVAAKSPIGTLKQIHPFSTSLQGIHHFRFHVLTAFLCV